MGDLFRRIWEDVIHRTEGPMSLRFILQPLISVVFAIRAGMKDAKSDTVPYLWRFISSKGKGKEIAKEAWKDVGKVFIVGVTLDIVYQLILIYGLKEKATFYPFESILVAFILALVPYLILRGPANRIIKMFGKKNKSSGSSKINSI